MKEIKLTRGYVAIVDDEDYEQMMMHSWRANVGKRANGESRVYAIGAVNGVQEYMHKVIMGYPNSIVDHIDGNPLNNTRANLRLCTHRQNLQNSLPSGKGTSKYKGVSWEKGAQKWRGRIMVNGVPVNLGFFETEEEAAIAYDAAARFHFGEYAKTNDSDISSTICIYPTRDSETDKNDWEQCKHTFSVRRRYLKIARRLAKQLNSAVGISAGAGLNIRLALVDGRVVVET